MRTSGSEGALGGQPPRATRPAARQRNGLRAVGGKLRASGAGSADELPSLTPPLTGGGTPYRSAALFGIGFLWLRDNRAFEGNPWVVYIYEFV